MKSHNLIGKVREEQTNRQTKRERESELEQFSRVDIFGSSFHCLMRPTCTHGHPAGLNRVKKKRLISNAVKVRRLGLKSCHLHCLKV